MGCRGRRSACDGRQACRQLLHLALQAIDGQPQRVEGVRGRHRLSAGSGATVAMVVVNTGSTASEPRLVMAAVVRNMANATGMAGGGSRPELQLPDCYGRGWGCVVEGNPDVGLCHGRTRGRNFLLISSLPCHGPGYKYK